MKQYLYSLESEWIKTRRSTASWLVIAGGFFIPLIVISMRLLKPASLASVYKAADFWERTFVQNWQVMAFFLLPMGIILAASLITQLEYRNNTWKQLHTTPQKFSTVFFAKLSVIILMMLQFFVFFNIGIYLSAAVPAWIYRDISLPANSFPYLFFLQKNAIFFVDCLPIIAIQYLVGLQFKNFLVPLGVGIGLLVAASFAVSWEYGYMVPYTYSLFNFFEMSSGKQGIYPAVNFHLVAAGYFVTCTIASYILYINKKDKC